MYAIIPAWNTILSTWSNPTSPSGIRVVVFLSFFFFFSGCAGSLLLHRLSLVSVSESYSLVLVCKLLLMGVSLVVEHGF